jgi:hypothetical protein
MNSHISSRTVMISLMAVATALFGAMLFAGGNDASEPKPNPSLETRLRIEVTAGDKSDPIGSASVYVKYVVKHTMGKDENVEMSVKTSQQGVAIVNGIPRGDVLIQVIAEGWKSYGEWYKATEDEQTIKIHMVKPPKWF